MSAGAYLPNVTSILALEYDTAPILWAGKREATEVFQHCANVLTETRAKRGYQGRKLEVFARFASFGLVYTNFFFGTLYALHCFQP